MMARTAPGSIPGTGILIFAFLAFEFTWGAISGRRKGHLCMCRLSPLFLRFVIESAHFVAAGKAEDLLPSV